MASAHASDISADKPALYEIRVRGTLGDNWREIVEDLTLEVIEVDDQPVTVLRATLRDQAALAGLLDALFGVNATVLSVEAIEPAPTA